MIHCWECFAFCCFFSYRLTFVKTWCIIKNREGDDTLLKEFYNTQNPNLGLYMVNCGYEDCADHFIAYPQFRKYYLIHYVTKGSGYYEVNNRCFFIKQGDIFIIHPNELVSYYSPDPKNTWSFCWIGFMGEDALSYLKYANMLEYTRSLKNQDFYALVLKSIDYFEKARVTATPLSQCRLSSLVLRCLDAITNVRTNVDRLTDYAGKAISYIEYNYMNGITTKDVAAHLSIDRTHLYRIFKKKLGVSPEEYIIATRMSKAKELLKQSSYSISEIATFVGMRNPSCFTRAFQKTTGISPTHFRSSG